MTRLILDGNSILNAALLRGEDFDDGFKVEFEGKQVQVNSAQYGVDNFFEKFVDTLKMFNAAPVDVVCVWDGRNSKVRRRTFLERYKQGRDKAPEISEQMNIAREKVSQMLLDLGCHVVHQEGMEADDVIGYLCKKLRTQKNIVVTSDGDLCVLVDENTDVWKAGSPVWKDGSLNKNPYGPFPHKFITLYKATVGDTGDKIPGAKGFGDGKFVDLVAAFGVDGLQALEDLILDDQLPRLREDLDALPCLKYLLDDQNGIKVSWRVASLMIDDVNTRDRPLVIRPGLVKQWADLAPLDRVDDLKDFYGTKTLVHAGNYDQVKRRFASAVRESPFVAMDIETSNGEESDAWLQLLASISEKGEKKEKVDVLGSKLTGMGLTFGANLQHTIYMTVDHREEDDVKNISVDQCRELCELIPHTKMHTVIHNRGFEFPVLYKAWGEEWKDNGWAGFWPNAIDTMQGSSYTDENKPQGLKDQSMLRFGYQQQTYEEVTTMSGLPGTLPPGGRVKGSKKVVLEDGQVEEHEIRQFKMKELTARHVFGYGSDDPMCTAALHNHYRFVMEMEGTWQLYLDVEQKPQYLTSLAYTQGFPVSLEKLTAMERRDEDRFAKAWTTLREYLLKNGWEGSTCPQFLELTPAAIKQALAICVEGGEEFTSRKSKPNALAADIRTAFPDNDAAHILAEAFERGDLNAVNGMVKASFTGEPKINFDSPKQMQNLFYRVIGVTPRILNKMTKKERADNETMVDAFNKRRKAKKSGQEPNYTAQEREALIAKASTDDTAVDMALKLDTDLTDEQREVLTAFKSIKTVMTRRKMYYKTYKVIPHWTDGKVHANLNQSRAVTRRYSASDPNVNAIPKRGDGVEFRQIVLPHKKGAVVGSQDFSGQELRLMAELSGDTALTSCYVGDNLRHPHVLLAVQAAPLMWEGQTPTYDEIQAMRKLPHDDPRYTKAKTLYEDSKTTNFATQYDGQAETVSHSLLCDEETAQLFIDAKEKTFPGVTTWKDNVRGVVQERGYATTMLGARRHLAHAFQSDDRWEAQRAGRQGPNFEIQGSAAEMTKLAMCRMWDSGVFTSGKYDCVFYFPVHDEVVYSVVAKDAAPVTRIVHECMTEPYAGMKIPVVSEISLGPNYGSQHECGAQFNEKAVNDAVYEALKQA